ncbi:MAG: hypothetical protein EZS28_007805 [Streblomastix strix]|uniref:Uncharacterized protein n=1 Tax=Streblomastix strix TaxID=222440 RepID=A0A5J4WNY4_9EUKA|nr:MAG: hypothetical protein EZS28_007805 [Streblomastix strix]
MTRLLDLYPYDRPSQILLTTFKKQVHILTQQEIESSDLNPRSGLSPLAQVAVSQIPLEGEEYIPQRSYQKNDGAVLLIAGYNGKLETSIIPLSVLLDFSPDQPKNGNTDYQAQFFFPSLLTSIQLYPQKVKIVEDGGIVYVYGDRASALTWSDRACKIIWTSLQSNGIIHKLMPIRVVDEELTLQQYQSDNKSEYSEKNSMDRSQQSQQIDSTVKTEIPHPTLVWIDYVDKKLTFGTIQKRKTILRDVKDLPSLPLAVAHLPSLHAVAVLCREYSQYPYYEQVQELNENFDRNEFLKAEDTRQEQEKTSIKYGMKDLDNNFSSSSLVGLGLDVSGILGVDPHMFQPYYQIFHNYVME